MFIFLVFFGWISIEFYVKVRMGRGLVGREVWIMSFFVLYYC